VHLTSLKKLEALCSEPRARQYMQANPSREILQPFKEMEVKVLSRIKNLSLVSFVVLPVLISAVSISALAASKTSVSRSIYQGEAHTGKCCSNWGDPIEVVEPDKLVPIVVTWSTDYRANASLITGLRVNGGPCTFYGPAFIRPFTADDETYASRTAQFVIMPGDYKLVPGTNTIQVCGGGVFAETDSVVLGFSTLTARPEK